MNADLLLHADQLLRGHDLLAPQDGVRDRHRRLVVIVLLFAPVYGGMMGSYHLDTASRLLQVLYSGIKLPILLFATSLICLPGFFVLNTVLGLRDDFADAMRAILAGQAGLSIVLAALAPITRFIYFCDISYRGALLWSAGMLAMATFAAQTIMLRHYRVLIARRPNHRYALTAWVVLYAFVGIQMGWTLRPFVGALGEPTSFFRREAFTNAYIVVIGLIFGG